MLMCDLMGGKRGRRQAPGERRGRRKDADFERDLHGRWKAEGRQPAHPRGIDAKRRVEESRIAAPFAIDDGQQQPGGHEHAREDSRPRRPAYAGRRQSEPAEDEHPVEDRVDNVGQDERNHDRADRARRLQVASKRRVQQERQEAPRHDLQIVAREGEDPGIQTPEMQSGDQCEQNGHHGNGQRQAERDAVHQPAMAVIEPIGTVALRHERVEAEQHPHGEDTHAHEDGTADADSTDRLRSQWPDHERIDDPHRHPRELREHDRHGQREHRLELFAEVIQRKGHSRGLSRV